MKALVESLKGQLGAPLTPGQAPAPGASGPDPAMLALEQALMAKQAELAAQLSGNQGPSPSELLAQEQREEYAKRGIALTQFESDTEHEHFVNLDPDPFRSKRFMYILAEDETQFGRVGYSDINLLGIGTKQRHCMVKRSQEGVFLVGQDGEVVHNGNQVKNGDQVKLTHLDRVVMGGEITLYMEPGKESGTEMSP